MRSDIIYDFKIREWLMDFQQPSAGAAATIIDRSGRMLVAVVAAQSRK